MKHIYSLSSLILFSISMLAQTVLLNIDGEAPDPFDDNSGNNTVNSVGTPLATGGAIEFPTGDDYLRIDPFADFDMQEDWSVEFKIQVTDPMDSVYPIDWRSNNSTGHMNIGYNGVRGLYFSDRNLNGIYGSLVADPNPVPANTWVAFKVELDGDSMKIWRDGVKTASAYFNQTFSEISTTTIGYSEDFRYDHSGFMMDDLVVTANPISSIQENPDLISAIYPIPTSGLISIQIMEKASSIQVIGADGRSVMDIKTTDNIADLSHLPNAIYVLRVVSDHGFATQRIVKQ